MRGLEDNGERKRHHRFDLARQEGGQAGRADRHLSEFRGKTCSDATYEKRGSAGTAGTGERRDPGCL